MFLSNSFSTNQALPASSNNILPLTKKRQNSYHQPQQLKQNRSQKRYTPAFVAERSENGRCDVHFGMLRYCRIKQRHSDRSLRAIEYNGKYYSFLKLVHSWPEAEAIATQLDSDFVITVMTQGWAIWLYRQ
jgi:hypothetical protein